MHRERTVLVAGVHGSVELLAAAGKTAGVHAITGALLRMRDVAQSHGGTLVRETGDEVMLVFDSPDAAAMAASRIHIALDALAPVAGVKLASQVGIHTGPVVERSGDLLGDTINIALRMVQAAQRGQTVTTQQTAALLRPPTADSRLYVIPLGAQGGDVRLYEVSSQPRVGAHPGRARRMLRLTLSGTTVVCERGRPSLVIGREPASAFVVRDPLVSRRHCTLALGDDGFELVDHSLNGTYVTNGEGSEVLLVRTRVPLAVYGWISLGQPRHLTAHSIEFFGD